MRRRTKTSRFGTSSRVNHDASAYYASRLYAELPAQADSPPAAETPFPSEWEDRVVAHSSEHMAEIPDNAVHLMVTSPPYNVSKTYDEDLSLGEYLDLLGKVFTETFRVLVDGGRACVNVANLGRKPYIPLSDYITRLMQDIGFGMRGEIIWVKGAGAGISMAWGSWQSASNPVLRDTHEYIMVFSKGAYKRQKPAEKVNTISREEFMEWTKSVWTMKTESARKVGHPAPFPLELPARLIQLYTYRGDVVLDPFLGSGTTALAARQAQRKFIGYEIDPQYATLAEARLAGTRPEGA